jgi:hypothetical protein
VSSALANALKTDLDEVEFHAFMRMLDGAMHGGKFDRSKLEFKYWRRNRL